MTRNRNYDPCSRKRMNTCGGVVAWSNLNHDVLYSVMMRLGVVDFISFSGVCKLWRSLAIPNRKRFMASRPPMLMYMCNKMTCYLRDFEGRKFRTLIPQLVGRECVGLTCGYLILFGEQTRDFWLVNPITRHELHFPGVTFEVKEKTRGVLVFSPSINGWVFVMTSRFKQQIWFSISAGGKGGEWNHVSSTFPVLDLHPFKGKIYTLNFWGSRTSRYQVCEMRLDPVPKLTVIDTHFPDPVSCVYNFVSSDDNLYLMEYSPRDMYKVHKLGFDDQLNWVVPCEKTRQEYVLFHSNLKFSALVKPESWAGPSSQYARFFDTKKRGKHRCYVARRWYFPNDCLNVNLIDE